MKTITQVKSIFIVCCFWVVTFLFGWGVTSNGIFDGIERIILSLLFGTLIDGGIALLIMLTIMVYKISGE